MSESNLFEIQFYNSGKKIVLEPNELTKFSFLLKNIGSKYFPLVSIDLFFPPSIYISKTHKGIGGVPSGSKRRIFLKIRGDEVGIYPLKIRINSKKNFISEKELTIQVGDTSQISSSEVQQQGKYDEPSITEIEPISEKNVIKCLKCGAENKPDAIYCTYCGQNLKEQKETKICNNCGAEQSLKAKFCGNCGAKLI